MKQLLTIYHLMEKVFTVNAQTKKENIEALNKLFDKFDKKLGKPDFLYRATDEGLYLTIYCKTDAYLKDAKGCFMPQNILLTKWSNMSLAVVRPETDTQHVWIEGLVNVYILNDRNDDLEYNGRSYSFYHDQNGYAIFSESGKLELLCAIARLLNTIRVQ